MTLAKALMLYAFQGGPMPVLMLGCTALAITLVLLKSLQLWWLLQHHDEHMETLEAIVQVPSPSCRLRLLRRLRQRMSGMEGRLLDIVLSTPIGGVRSDRLASELAYCRGRLEFWFSLIARLALAAPAIGFVSMLYAIAANDGVAFPALYGSPFVDLLPLLFGTLMSLPALLLLFIADHCWLGSLGQVNKHSVQLSQLPTGLQGSMG